MKHRLFFAITCPDTVKNQILSLQKKLDKLDLPVVWEEANKLHLNLNFLGNKVDSAELTGVRRAAFNVTAQTPVFDLSLSFLETLYLRHEETRIYLSPGKMPELLALQNNFCIELNKLGLHQPKRYLPHMTFGRLKRTDPVTTKDCINKISNFEYNPVDSFAVDKVILFESFVSAKGSHFQSIGEFVLKSPSNG